MSPNCHDIRWDTYCFSNVTVSPQNLCLFSLSDTRISRNASGELISAARLILSASAQERLNFGMVAGKPNLSNTVGKRTPYRISYEDGLAASADFEGGSPEGVCTTKEIRGAEVNVLSMCGRAGTAASSLPIPRGASSGISCDEVFSGRLVETRHIEGNDAEMAAQQVVSRRQTQPPAPCRWTNTSPRPASRYRMPNPSPSTWPSRNAVPGVVGVDLSAAL